MQSIRVFLLSSSCSIPHLFSLLFCGLAGIGNTLGFTVCFSGSTEYIPIKLPNHEEISFENYVDYDDVRGSYVSHWITKLRSLVRMMLLAKKLKQSIFHFSRGMVLL